MHFLICGRLHLYSITSNSKKIKQIRNQLKKSFDNCDFNKIIDLSKDETQTCDNLIHHFY